MKIICVVDTESAEPSFFLKPDSALLLGRMPFFYPDFSNDICVQPHVVVRIDKVGKSIQERFAHKYYREVTLGLDIFARDLQRQLVAQGQPWTPSECFDGSAVLGAFVPYGESPSDAVVTLQKNGEEDARYHIESLHHTVDRLISRLSHYMLLRTGDYIFTGSPVPPVPIQIDDTLEATLNGRTLLSCRIK